MRGSKREAKHYWKTGRGRHSLRGEIKFSIKKNKKYLTRKARHCKDAFRGCAYKKLVKEKAWDYVT